MKNFFLFLFRFIITFGYRIKSPHAIPKTTTLDLAAIQNTAKISFFTVAHPDDIELFMGCEARHQIIDNPDDKKVFIVLTGGDANRKNRKKVFRAISWWHAREKAHTAAISFWNNNKDQVVENEVLINQRYVTRISIGSSIVLYNLRLTDADKTTSLDELVEHKSQYIYDVVHQQQYSLEDIKESLINIINLEMANAQEAAFYITDEDSERNPGDHLDHRATSLILLDIYPKISVPKKSLFAYLTYFIKTKPINLQGEDKDKSFETWKIMGDELDTHGYKKNDDPYHMQWVGKEYKSYTIPASQENISQS
ncbi:PIG-L family deacetylase [Acinetobacter silvestris]|uniref:PIG-L family deacetylase n=1 Tax=Acinetobacter silvestris TaxID=1977882 RepID=A0A1Y3CP07_9GAMM|nr:PIG-L family deacetylase [Acinetobacter silvestris]OTG67356.1 hypothetical protein B9T28_01625 [Acinetobacter silvestris]